MEKMLLAQVQEARFALSKEQLAILADTGDRFDSHLGAYKVTTNVIFQSNGIDLYDSYCDEVPTAQASFMANLSSYGSDVLLEYFEQTPIDAYPDNEITSDSNIISYSQYLLETQQAAIQDINSSAQQVSMILSVIEQMFERMINHVSNWDKANKEANSESLTAELERYKERVKTCEQRLNVDLSSREKLIDSQIDDMIRDRLALKQEIDSLKQTLSNQTKKKESLLQTFNVSKNESKEKESKYMDKEIYLEKKIKELDNIVVKVRTTPDAITEGSWGFKHTKKVFNEEIIPFKNSLQTSVKDFENGLLNEFNEVKTVFNQMEAVVDQYVVNIVMHADDKYVNVLPVQNTFLDDNIALDVMKMENDHELSQMNELSKTCSRLEQRCISLELKLQHNKESFQNDKPCENWDAPEFHEFFIINELKAQLQAKDTTISKLKKLIQELKGKSIADCRESVNKPKVIAQQITKENADTLHDIVEQARTSNPLDNALSSPSRSEKLVVVTPMNKARKVTFEKTNATSENTTQKRVDVHKTRTTNKPLVPSTYVKWSTNASRSKPQSETQNTRIMQPLSSNQKYQRVEVHTRNAKSDLKTENSMSKSV
ncbi:hypothetical protein Tco_0004331 [Tanacetum coccineum]